MKSMDHSPCSSRIHDGDGISSAVPGDLCVGVEGTFGTQRDNHVPGPNLQKVLGNYWPSALRHVIRHTARHNRSPELVYHKMRNEPIKFVVDRARWRGIQAERDTSVTSRVNHSLNDLLIDFHLRHD